MCVSEDVCVRVSEGACVRSICASVWTWTRSDRVTACPGVCVQTKEEVVGTLEAVQGLQGHSGQLQKAREAYLSRCGELERLRKEVAPQKELEKVRRPGAAALPSQAQRGALSHGD